METLHNTLLMLSLSLSHSPHLFVNIISVRIINIDVAKLGCPPPPPHHTIPPLGVLQRVARPALHPDVGPVVAVAARPGVRLPAASLHSTYCPVVFGVNRIKCILNIANSVFVQLVMKYSHALCMLFCMHRH